MNKRIDRVNSLLEQEISKLIAKEFNFSGSLVTLTRVEVTANLIEAKVYISVFPEEKTEGVIKALNSGVPEVQRKINRMLNMRPIPKIIFVKDEKIKEAARVEALLETLKKDKK